MLPDQKSVFLQSRSFVKSLFRGEVDHSLFAAYPFFSAPQKEVLRLILDAFRVFAARSVDSALMDRESLIPPHVLDGMRQIGLFGLVIPEEYGGLGLDHRAYARVMEEVAFADASLAATMGAHQSIGLKGLLLFGNDAQKRQYLPRLATGESIAAFALTEPSAGSDASHLQMTATLDSSGQFYVLNGNKIWITNGGYADLFTVFAQVDVPSPGSGKTLTAFLVERAHGVRNGPPEHKLGIRASATQALYFDDVKVPVGNVLAEPGKGFKVAMRILNHGRLGLAAIAIGGCKKIIQLATQHANQRVAFGKPIREFDLVCEKIAHMNASVYALESMVYLTAGSFDADNHDVAIECALSKIYASETLWWVADQALQIAGGAGYMQAYPYERLLRDARITLIFEGTNEILRGFTALSGIGETSQALRTILTALRSPFAHPGLFFKSIKQWLAVSVFRKPTQNLPAPLQGAARVLDGLAAAIWKRAVSLVRKYKDQLVEQQFAHARLSQLAMDAYMLAASISRTKSLIDEKGLSASQREIDWVTLLSMQAQRRLLCHDEDFFSQQDKLYRKIAQQACKDEKYPPSSDFF